MKKIKDIEELSETFRIFTTASKSLEASYAKLQGRVQHLTEELAEKNKQLQGALSATEEAEDYLRGILESLNEAIVVLDTGDRVSMINRAAEEMFAMKAGDALGKTFGSLNMSFDTEGAEAVVVAGGRKRNVIVSRSEVLDAGKNVRGRVILIQDVTRLKELEAQQERNHRLIAMGEMAAKIVHEVRSPLCSIELYSSMLAKDLKGSGHMEMAEGISTGIKSLNNVLTNMLFFARPQKPVFKDSDLIEILEETLFMIRPLLDSRGLKLNRTGKGDIGILCDRELLKQVFLNILLNAVQATPDGGGLGLSLSEEEGFAVLEVTDEGEGIKEENLERIFDPFFSTKEKGTGLGLAIAAKIMQAHGGRINVRSTPDRGSCFQLYLPVQGGTQGSCTI